MFWSNVMDFLNKVADALVAFDSGEVLDDAQ